MIGEYIYYNDKEIKRMPFKHPREVIRLPAGNHWIHIPLTSDSCCTDAAKDLQRTFGIDRLTWEDITKGDHLPKIEIDDERIFIILQVLSYDEEKHRIVKDQVSILIQHETVYTFLHGQSTVFDIVFEKLKTNRNNGRERGLDYLLYNLIGAVMNLHFQIFKAVEAKMDEIESLVMRQSKGNYIHDLYKLRKEIMRIKSAVVPVKEMIRTVLYESRFVQEENRAVYLDINDRIVEINESLAYYRELINALYDMHLSNASNRMNRIMTTLTIYSAIFIPLTFLAGVYGMNFKYMPELGQKWAYPVFLVICASIASGMIVFFKKKRWI